MFGIYWEPRGTRVPDAIPLLTPGTHRRGEGSCLMEYVSVLAGERWTDEPRCTHPALAMIARLVNDRVSPATRARLVLAGPALVGTSSRDPRVVDVVVRAAARAGLSVRPDDRPLRRIERCAQSRLDGTGRGRPPGSLIVAYRRVQTVLLTEPVPLGDAVRIDLLESAVRDVREYLGRPVVEIGIGAITAPGRPRAQPGRVSPPVGASTSPV